MDLKNQLKRGKERGGRGGAGRWSRKQETGRREAIYPGQATTAAGAASCPYLQGPTYQHLEHTDLATDTLHTQAEGGAASLITHGTVSQGTPTGDSSMRKLSGCCMTRGCLQETPRRVPASGMTSNPIRFPLLSNIPTSWLGPESYVMPTGCAEPTQNASPFDPTLLTSILRPPDTNWMSFLSMPRTIRKCPSLFPSVLQVVATASVSRFR